MCVYIYIYTAGEREKGDGERGTARFTRLRRLLSQTLTFARYRRISFYLFYSFEICPFFHPPICPCRYRGRRPAPNLSRGLPGCDQ